MCSSACDDQMTAQVSVSGSQCHTGCVFTRNKVFGGRYPGMICLVMLAQTLGLQPFGANLNELMRIAAPFTADDRCPQSDKRCCRQHVTTVCQASTTEQVNRRGLLTAGISLAAAAQLQPASRANALVVSKEWEKVRNGVKARLHKLFSS